MVDSQDDIKAIEAVWHQAIEALAHCDWQAYSALWVHEPYVRAIHPASGSWWRGWEEVGERYMQIIGKGVPIWGITPILEIHISKSGDMAWATMESEVRTGKSGHRLAWQVVGFEKLGGEWRIALAFDAPRRARK